ncbi:glycosyltransferase [Dellaglioa algida]|uniref:Glycosyltransferase 2-like domain-containing protein n=1 Tax=Dellaglioa algida DSM 15638 TaxID=1423719 RepID=A0A0R1HQQ3_9LACO|nr:glycosyltransferase [Dellaglioa algida]KRK45514.1 hypothetical protein FC66_GL001329 [Dellaglioa algida DSM 15638]MDK1732055.1 glycosyltransferase [Dellaglioa algida]MDK1733581.1 glycosyltransferase [Dellaglioa algida]
MRYGEIKIINVIVIYNLLITDSPIFEGIKNELEQNTQILIVDNSTDENISRENKQTADLSTYCNYLNSGGNLGLSKAYNRVIDFQSQFNWVVFWDQDTTLMGHYLEQLRTDIQNNEAAKLIVPTVYSDRGQMSPRSYKRSKITNPVKGLGFKKKLTAINSGLAIEINTFIELGTYDDRMFIDYLDHDLVIRYNNQFGDIFVSSNVLRQKFSNDNHNNYQGDIFRFSKYIVDYKIFTENVSGSKCYFWMKIFYRALRLGVLHKNVSFLNEIFKMIRLK